MRRIPQAQITSTPSPKNNHTPYERNTTIASKKGRPGPAPPLDADDTQSHVYDNSHITLSPPRSPIPPPLQDHWGSEDESSDAPFDSLNTHDDLPRQPDAQSQLEHRTQGPHPKSPPRQFTKENRKRPSPKHPSTKRGPPTPQKSPVPQAIRQHAQRETPDHHKKQREGTRVPPQAHAPPTPGTTHINLHTEPQNNQ